MTTSDAANAYRVEHATPEGEPDVSVLSRCIVDRNGRRLVDGDTITPGGAALLAGGGGLGTINTIAADDERVIDAYSQAIVLGSFTIFGRLTVLGRLTFAEWPY